MDAVVAMSGEVKVRSMVDSLPDAGSTLVPRSIGVMKHAFCVLSSAS